MDETRKSNQPLIPVEEYYASTLSSSFKIWVVGFIFALVFFHLFTRLVFSDEEIISQKLMLGVVLVLVGYLWIQEVRDRTHLQDINAALVAAQTKLQNAEIDSISSLILLEEAKDPYAHGHSHRVAKFALAIGQKMEFSPDTLEAIRRAAVLHDLGKLAIPDAILFKPDRLTQEEWGVIKRHPQIAVDILEPLKFLHLEKKIILHHHERVDGQGYPARLKGKDIPLESRIIAVADTFDAMNSDRIFRDPCTKEYILRELTQVAGSQLDESMVANFLKLLEEHPDFWEREQVKDRLSGEKDRITQAS